MLRLLAGIVLLVASRPVARWWLGHGGSARRAVIVGAGVRDLIVGGGQVGVLPGSAKVWWRIALAMDLVDVGAALVLETRRRCTFRGLVLVASICSTALTGATRPRPAIGRPAPATAGTSVAVV